MAAGHIVIVALGANLGNRERQVKQAILSLELLAEDALQQSSLWESEASNCPPGSADYVNAVVRFRTLLGPLQLLQELMSIEQEFGQRVKGDNSPRFLDLDIIDYDGLSLTTQELVLPHPRASQRLFVLYPLRELLPEAELGGVLVSELIEQVASLERIWRFGSVSQNDV